MVPPILLPANLHSTEPFWLRKGPLEHKATKMLLLGFLSYKQSRLLYPDTILFPTYFSMAKKNSFKSQGRKKHQGSKDYRGYNTCTGTGVDFRQALEAGPLAHHLTTGEGHRPSFAYKYVGELCDRGQGHSFLLQQPRRWPLPAGKPQVRVL